MQPALLTWRMVYGFFTEPVAWQMRTDPSTAKKLHSSTVRAEEDEEPSVD